MQPLDQAIHIAVAIEDAARPRSREVAPLREVPRRPAQAIDRRVFARDGAEALPDGSPQRAAHAFARILELRLDPRAERVLEQALRLRLGQHREQRIDARFDWTLAQQLRAEAVDRADVRFLQRLQRGVHRVALAGLRMRSRHVERLAQPQLQLPRRFFRERDRDDPFHLRAPARQDPHDTVHELRRLPRSGGRLDNERVAQCARNRVPCERICFGRWALGLGSWALGIGSWALVLGSWKLVLGRLSWPSRNASRSPSR